MPNFYVGIREQNSGPQGCSVSIPSLSHTLPPPPNPRPRSFLNFLLKHCGSSFVCSNQDLCVVGQPRLFSQWLLFGLGFPLLLTCHNAVFLPFQVSVPGQRPCSFKALLLLPLISLTRTSSRASGRENP